MILGLFYVSKLVMIMSIPKMLKTGECSELQEGNQDYVLWLVFEKAVMDEGSMWTWQLDVWMWRSGNPSGLPQKFGITQYNGDI